MSGLLKIKNPIPVFLMMVLFIGCGPPPDRYKNGRLVITYWDKWTGIEYQAMKKVVDLFNRSQSRYWVEYLPVSMIERRFLVATAGGDPPDVAGLFSPLVTTYAFYGTLMPLDDYCKKYGISEDDYINVFWRACSYRGHIYALPTTPTTLALHWNKKLFRDAGLDPDRPPKTLQELDQMAERLTRRDENGRIIQMGFLPNEPTWYVTEWGFWFGARLWDGDRKILANEEANIRAYRWAQSYSKKYGVGAVQSFRGGFGSFSSSQNPFFSGKVAMTLQGVWMYNFIKTYAPEMEWGVAPFPSAVPGLENVTIADCDVLVIPTGARHPDGAFEFIRFVQTQKAMEMLCMGQLKFSPLRRVSEEFLRNHPHPYLKTFIDLAHSPNARFVPQLPIWRQYNDELYNAFDKVWLQLDTPEHALAVVQKKIQKLWDKYYRRLKIMERHEQEKKRYVLGRMLWSTARLDLSW